MTFTLRENIYACWLAVCGARAALVIVLGGSP